MICLPAGLGGSRSRECRPIKPIGWRSGCINLGGQVGLTTEDKKSVTAKRIKDLPEGNFTITRIDLAGRSRAADADLAEIAKLPGLEELNLSYTRITDRGLESLGFAVLVKTAVCFGYRNHRCRVASHREAPQNLPAWIFRERQVTNAGLKELAELPDLSRLFLGRTKITSEAVGTLGELEKLSVLHLSGDPVETGGPKSVKPTAGAKRTRDHRR